MVKGYRAKVHYIPEGYKEKEIPYKEIMSFKEYLEEYHGIYELNSKKDTKYHYYLANDDNEYGVVSVIRRTNPNAKWDWYQVGGRWTGFFKLKKGAKGEVGEPGLMTGRADDGYADQLKKCDIDIEGMRSEAGNKAQARYLEIEALFGGEIPKIETLWKDVLDGENFKDMSIDEKRKYYHSQDALVRLKKLQNKENSEKIGLFFDLEKFQCTKDEYVQRARDSALTTFAVIKEGQWYERGDMGWWGLVANEKDQDIWNKQFSKLIDDLPEDTMLTVVDCHI
jgi:hypothetical protein